MTRRKVSLAYISNDSERKASYKKRKKGLMKKMSELCTLCDVKGCLIIYSEYDPEPQVWPSHSDAQAILGRFCKYSETDKGRKMVNHESFTRQRIKKAEDKLSRLQKDNKWQQLECYMYQCITGTRTLDETYLHDVVDMNWVIKQALRGIQAKQDTLKAKFHCPSPSVDPFPSPLATIPSPMLPLPALSEEENRQSFMWNWNPVQSPMGYGAVDLEPGDFGWDPRMVQSYQYMFNSSTSNQQENQENNSNDFNYFNYFNN